MVRSTLSMFTLPGSPERSGPGHSSKNSTLDPAKQVCLFLFFFFLSPGYDAPPWLGTSSLLFLFVCEV